jgi:peroxiredoxin
MMLFRTSLIAGFVLLLTACGSGGGDVSADANLNALEPPAECKLEARDPAWVAPSGDLGDEVGDFIADFETSITDCDGNSISLYDVISQSELTLFNVGAGWCEPCVEESQTIDAEIFREFCPRGLRVVQVLFQDEESRPATKLFCDEWRNRFSLSFPVAVDPLFTTMEYFDSVTSQTPLNFLVDRTGKIVFKETGTPAEDLPDRIDARLP